MTEPDGEPFVFVVMSFTDAMDEVYELAIRPACRLAGAGCVRVDQEIHAGNVLALTYDRIRMATLVVAELTEPRPNVYYEAGYAHGVGKLVIPVSAHDNIPYDWRHYNHIVYGNDLVKLQRELARHVGHYLENPDKIVSVTGRDADFALMARHITNYLVANRFQMVSFARIRERINAGYRDEDLRRLIDRSPDSFRRARLKGGREGIALLRRK
jgi:hypothetical protein